MMILILYITILICLFISSTQAQSDIMTVVFREVNGVHYNYTAESRIYPEDNTKLFITNRHGGLTILDITYPNRPFFHFQWNYTASVEGQDRKGDLLVLVDIEGSGIWTFDIATIPYFNPLGYASVSDSGALHVKLYTPCAECGYDTVAMVTVGFSQKIMIGKLTAVDVSNPAKPTVISTLVLPKCFNAEGIYLRGDYAYAGGYEAKTFTIVDISDVENMKIIDVLTKSYYVQMVGSMLYASHMYQVKEQALNTLYVASWGTNEGGLIAFDTTNPSNIQEMTALIVPELSKSNRVKLHASGSYAVLALEQSQGAIGLIGLSGNAGEQMKLIETYLFDYSSTTYTISIQDDYIYAFGATSCTMYVIYVNSSRI